MYVFESSEHHTGVKNDVRDPAGRMTRRLMMYGCMCVNSIILQLKQHICVSYPIHIFRMWQGNFIKNVDKGLLIAYREKLKCLK